MRQLIFVLLLTFSALLTSCATAPEGVHLEIESAWVRSSAAASGSTNMDAMAPSASTSAAYMVIRNAGTEPDTLLTIRSDAAEVAELHISETQNGVTMMSAVENVPVPARDKVELKPGGLHIMLIKLKQELTAGEKITLTLVFEKSGEIQIEAEIKNP